MRPTGGGMGGNFAHIWLLAPFPAKEQVDNPADMGASVGPSEARHSR
jgi:hypothetical protein